MFGDRKNLGLGYLAGVGAGVSYGMNPLFIKGLLAGGAAVHSILFFRYFFALVMMSAWIALRRERIRIKWCQVPLLLVMGVLFALSSEGLFQSYKYISAGLATTIVYLYPIFSAFLLLMLGQRPSWQSWTAIAGTLAGVVLICIPSGGVQVRFAGVMCAAASAFVYAVYLVMVNNSRRVETLSPNVITLFALVAGTVLFLVLSRFHSDHALTYGIHGAVDWLCLAGLGLFPTMISMLCLAVSTRRIGPAKTGVLGVFEPITAILIGIFIYGETLSVQVAVGMAIAIVSVVFLVLTKHRN